jgi:SAM-dependent methyltransferase
MLHTTQDPALVGNPIDDVLGTAVKYSALTAAAKLGLIRALQDKALDAAELAAAIGASEQGTRTLADVLVCAGYLELDNSRYRHGPLATRWLRSDAERDFTPALLWTYELWNMLWELPEAIVNGKPSQSVWQRWAERPEAGRDFSDYMKVKSTLTVGPIVDATPIPKGATRLLDLGGSHGLHSIAFCHRYPELRATIVDLPEALADTPTAIAEAGLIDRITLQPGNLFLEAELGTGYDVVLLFEMLHLFTPEENQALLERAASALRPGGRVVILDDVRIDELDEHNAVFSLCLFACSGGQTYPLDEIEAWLRDAGFGSLEHIALPSSVSLVVGTRNQRGVASDRQAGA